MASDPRFDVFPDQYTETEQRRSKWASCLIGCLMVLGVMLVLAIIAGVWISRNLRGWAADIGTQVLDQGIEASDLPPQEKGEVKVQVERVTKAFRDGQLNGEQVGMIAQKVFQSPLMPALVAAAIDMRYFEKSGLNADEKTQGRITLQRFARGMLDEKIAQQGIDAVMGHVAMRQPDGTWRLRQQVSDEDLRAALTEAKAQADKAGIPEAPENVDPSDEFKRIIDEALKEPAH